MRSMIISLILFVAVLLSASGSAAFLEQNIDSLCALLQQIEDRILADDWPAAKTTFAGVEEKWQSNEHFWHLIIDQKDIMEIDATMQRAGAYVRAEDLAQGTAELAALYSQYQHIMLLEKVTWDNIL